MNEFNQDGKVVVTNCDYLVPTMHIGAKSYIVPKINDEKYIDELLKICKLEKIDAILSLIDSELSILANNSKYFDEIGVKVLVSDFDTTELCFDKMVMFEFFEENNFRCTKTYCDLDKFKIINKGRYSGIIYRFYRSRGSKTIL